MHGGGLELTLVFLLAAVIAVPVFRRFGLGAVLGGRIVLRHVFRMVARTQMSEVFTGAALLTVLGAAWRGSCRARGCRPDWARSSPACCWPIRNSATNSRRRNLRAAFEAL